MLMDRQKLPFHCPACPFLCFARNRLEVTTSFLQLLLSYISSPKKVGTAMDGSMLRKWPSMNHPDSVLCLLLFSYLSLLNGPHSSTRNEKKPQPAA